MPRPLRKQFGGAKYHVSVRGNGRRRIFQSDADQQRFLFQLQEALERDDVILYAYVLMSNHYHLLVETPRGNLARFMHRLNTAYSTYYRYKHNHSGSVLQPRYKAKLVKGDEYLIRLTRYIHLNPIRIRRLDSLPGPEKVAELNRYQWSSYGGYVRKDREEPYVNYRWRGLVGGGVGSERRSYRRYIESMVEKDDEQLSSALTQSKYAIGDDDFIAEVEDEMKAIAQAAMVSADIEGPEEGKIELGSIEEAVCEEYGCEREDLRRHGHAVGEAKSVAIELACSLGGMTNRSVGMEYGGISGAAIGYQRRMLAETLAADTATRKRFNSILKKLKRPT